MVHVRKLLSPVSCPFGWSICPPRLDLFFEPKGFLLLIIQFSCYKFITRLNFLQPNLHRQLDFDVELMQSFHRWHNKRCRNHLYIGNVVDNL